jgi:hypothetical protein
MLFLITRGFSYELEYEIKILCHCNHLLHPNRAEILQKLYVRRFFIKISLWQYNCRHCLVEISNDTVEFGFQSMAQKTPGTNKSSYNRR